MARPVNANAERTRRSILDAASSLFSAHGFEGTSVRKIAHGAGVSLGMIRHYFGSKEGLYRACISSSYEIFGQIGAQISAGLATGGSPGEVIGEAVRRGFRYVVSNRNAFKLLLWNLMSEESWRTDMGDREMLPFILLTAKGMNAVTGRDTGELALVSRTLIFLIVRYATADDDEIAYLLTAGDPNAKATEATMDAIETHLVDVAMRLISP